MIRFRCQQCNTRFTVEDRLAGRKARCRCGAVTVIPRLEQTTPPTSDKPTPLRASSESAPARRAVRTAPVRAAAPADSNSISSRPLPLAMTELSDAETPFSPLQISSQYARRSKARKIPAFAISLLLGAGVFVGGAVVLLWTFGSNEVDEVASASEKPSRAKSESSAPRLKTEPVTATSTEPANKNEAAAASTPAPTPSIEVTAPKEVIDRAMRIEYVPPVRLSGCSDRFQAEWQDWWKACTTARSTAPLLEQLRRKLALPATASDEELREQASNADLTMAAAQEALLRYSGEQAITQLLADEPGQEFLRDLLTDRAWLESWLSSGFLTKDEQGRDANYAATGLSLLARIHADDPRLSWNPVTRNMAVACALAFSQPFQKDRLAGHHEILPRYQFFKESWRQGRLHESFDKLQAWDMRYILGALWKDDSLAWLQQNLRVPISRMGWACWFAPYRGGTIFGESIHGSRYYTPWSEEMCLAENVHRHGGVCGSLSYTGAMSCIARGIPAVPCGQPGHCAYGYRPEPGQWLGGFGGPGGGCHGALYGHNSAYRDMAEDTHADFARNLQSRRHAWQAERADNEGEQELAARAWRLATVLPSAYQSWLERIEWSLQQPSANWQEMTSELRASFAKHPYVLFDLLRKFESKAEPTPAGRLALWSDIHRQVADAWLYPTWNDLNHILSAQAAALGNSTDAKMEVAEMILAAEKGSAKTFPAALQWAQGAYPKNEAGQKRWIDVLARTLDTGLAGDQGSLKKVFSQAILAASSAGARDAFQQMSEHATLQCNIAPPALPKFKPFAGEKFSAGGILRTSSTSNWDDPCMHAGVLDTGGRFHTEGEVHPWAEVQLRKLIDPSGIVVIPTDSNRSRLFPLQIEVSEDGQKWQVVGKFAKEQNVCSVDLTTEHRRVRYVRVSRSDDRKEFFHLFAINVWGKALE